jgi:predicted MFS family arabinose efflux permease
MTTAVPGAVPAYARTGDSGDSARSLSRYYLRDVLVHFSLRRNFDHEGSCSSWRLLRYRNFRWYFLGGLVSNLGTWLQNTAQVLLAYELTHSVFAVGVVVSAQFAGTLLVSPWAAVLANRIGYKTTLVGSQVASALVAAGMAWRFQDHLFGEHTLIVGALCLGLAFSLALPVQMALLSAMVEPADTEAAMAMNSVSYNSGRALAPALSVLVIALFGPVVIFAVNAASFALFAVILGFLRSGSVVNALSRRSPAGESRLQRARVADGIRVARRNRRMLLLLAIVASVTFADDPVQVLSPGLVHALHVSSSWTGYFIAALGWGTVLGSLLPLARRKVIDPRSASRRAAISLLILALSMVVFTAQVSALVSLTAALVAGGAALFTGAATQSLIVGHNRGAAASVAGLWAIAWAGTKPVASLFDGWSASHIGIWPTGLLLASPAVLLALGEIFLPAKAKNRVKNWSLSRRLDSLLTTVNYPDWLPDWPLALVGSVMRPPNSAEGGI